MIVLIALVSFLAFTSMRSYGQEWTKEQKELWAVVESSWKAWSDNSVDKMMANVHERYLGWSDDMPMPSDKATIEKFFRKYANKLTEMDFEIIPARIVVVDNVGVVHYYFYYTYAYGEPKKTVQKNGKYVEFYVKKGNSWLLIGDFTYHKDTEDEED